MRAVAALVGIFLAVPTLACNIDYGVNLKTLGASMTVELRLGMPGNSKLVETRRSSGGKVQFVGLCPGNYFLAIGNEEYVDVTPIRNFQDGYSYESEIQLKRGPGNIDKKKRSGL